MASAEDRTIAALRRIVRAIDLHSRALLKDYRLTGPQLALLQQVARHGPATVGSLAKAVHLGAPTVTGVVDRLERQGFVERIRGERDRRKVLVAATGSGRRQLAQEPSLLHQSFRAHLDQLPEWEQAMVYSVLERVASMMESEAAERPAVPAAHAAPPGRPSGQQP